LTITIADLAGTSLDETAVIDRAIKMLSSGGEVMFNIPQRIDSVYGRSVGIKGGDGSRSTIGVFDYRRRLYQIEAKALPGGSDGAAEALRFQQSLVFTDGGSNRSEETSAPIAKPALTLSAHLQASMIHAAPMPGNEKLWRGCVMEGHSTRGPDRDSTVQKAPPRGHCGASHAEWDRGTGRSSSRRGGLLTGRATTLARSELISALGTRACP
jgi:hypothetical protein